MLGPSGYHTKVLRGVEPPRALPGLFGAPATDTLQVLVVGFGFRSVSQVEMWRRLLHSSEHDQAAWRVGFVGEQWSESELEAARDMLPPSLRWQMCLWLDADREWQKWLSPEDERTAFAVFPKAHVIMVGPANEDAWDEAQALIKLDSHPPV